MVSFICVLVALPNLQAQIAKKQDSKPIDYRLTCEYLTVSFQGLILAKKRIQGTYHIDKELKWTDVTTADASADGPYGNGHPMAFMEGFAYKPEQIATTGTEGFFSKIPTREVECRNLIWDTHMFENYAYDHLADLKLNEPFTISKDKTTPLGAAGAFHDHDVNLTWVGDGEWKGQKCALILYRAFFNTFDYKMGELPVTGTSDYWGEIWLAKRTKRIANATIFESVGVSVGTSKTPYRSFRIGTFEALPGRSQKL